MRSTRETTEDFGRRESYVQEQSDHGMRNELSDHLRDEEKMVIIDPYCVTALVLAHDGFGKGFVDSDIVLPTILLPNLGLWVIGDLVMERRPNDLLAIPIVMTIVLGVRNKDWNRLFVNIEIIRDIRLLCLCQCICILYHEIKRKPSPKVCGVMLPSQEYQSTCTLSKHRI